MLRLVVAVAAFAGAISEPAPPTSKPVQLTPKGYATSSCATTMSETGVQAEADTLYIDGVWDGLNMSENVNVGWSTDQAGIKGEVFLECQKRPSDILINAIYQARLRLKKAGR